MVVCGSAFICRIGAFLLVPVKQAPLQGNAWQFVRVRHGTPCILQLGIPGPLAPNPDGVGVTADLVFWTQRSSRPLREAPPTPCPRLNPDGAELALADKPRHIRSSTRRYPFDEEAVDGLTIEDVDGDGRMLSMRIPDPHGPYKKHATEPRLMVAREPGEFGGEYYRIVPEGTLKNFDGFKITANPNPEGLDLNRNFPAGWRQDFEQDGAGPYPTSEPEVRAMVDFITQHPNIGAAVSFHTHSGVILRPMGSQSDDDMTPEDLWMIKRLSASGATATTLGAPSFQCLLHLVLPDATFAHVWLDA